MVYEVKCDNCGKIIDFGGRRPEDSLDAKKTYPDNVIEFDGGTYCKDCVEEFVKFGIGEINERLEYLEDRMEEVLDTLGISKAQGGSDSGS
jgi:hypothetical protein